MISAATSLLKQGDNAFDRRDYAKAGELFQKAAEAAQEEGSDSILAEALSMTARSYLIREEGAQGKPWIERAAAVATPDEPRGWSRYLGVRGRFEWKDQKRHAKATATFKEMYEYCLKHQLYSRAVDAAHMVAIAGGPEEQIEWAHKGIKAAESSEEAAGWLGPLWNNLGWTHDERKDYDNALAALLKAREYHYKGKSDLAKLTADIFVSRAYRMTGDIDQAETWITEAHDWAAELVARHPENQDFHERLGNTHEQLGEIAIARGNSAEGIQHLHTARDWMIKAGAEKWGPEELRKLSGRITEAEARGR